ncbi:MAG: molybdopterin-dependent oxidoreductase [Clostridiales bacterium]|nr:molybdopterin-dependent oxidoreductase [Clostridiales bacterium]
MKTKKIITCPLDCFDLCMIDVHIEGENIIELKGNKEHPMTQGFICQKGRDHLKRHLSEERIKAPMKKVDGKWIEISYEEAENLLVEKLMTYDRKSIIHYNDSGYTGISKEVDELFFNHLGGVVSPRGSLCWSAGIQATKDTFNDVISSNPDEIENAEVIVLWGRNPIVTNIHLANRLSKAKNQGKIIILIDPILTESAALATDFIRVRPDTDHLLALAIIKIMKDAGKIDEKKIVENSIGWEVFADSIDTFSLEDIYRETQIPFEKIKYLAELYSSKRVITYIGYGIQRYKRGGNTVKAINALSFTSRNYGKKGTGINYAHKGFSKLIEGYLYESIKFVDLHDTFVKSKFGQYVKDHDIKMLFVTKSNPLVQLPNLNLVNEAIERIEFKVGIDLFMTDTMAACNLVFPASNIFEEEDVFYSSMYSPYLQYSEKVIDNTDIKGEYDLFQSLALKMDIKSYPIVSKELYLAKALDKVFLEHKITLKELKETKYIRLENDYQKFEKFRFINDEGKVAVEVHKPFSSSEYPLRLISPKIKNSLHSQGFREYEGLPDVYMSQNIYNQSVKEKYVEVESRQGTLKGRVVIRELADDIIVINEGHWQRSGSVNRLTSDEYSDIGDQAAYYDTFVKIRGIK